MRICIPPSRYLVSARSGCGPRLVSTLILLLLLSRAAAGAEVPGVGAGCEPGDAGCSELPATDVDLLLAPEEGDDDASALLETGGVDDRPGPQQLGESRWYAAARSVPRRRSMWMPSFVRLEVVAALGDAMRTSISNTQSGLARPASFGFAVLLRLRWEWAPARVASVARPEPVHVDFTRFCRRGDGDCIAAFGDIGRDADAWLATHLGGAP
jgi:hypothetical protein